jgi:hypothetical protein
MEDPRGASIPSPAAGTLQDYLLAGWSAGQLLSSITNKIVLKKEIIHALIAIGEVSTTIKARELYLKLINQKILIIVPAKEISTKPQPYLTEDDYFQDSSEHDMSQENNDFEWDEDFSPPIYRPTGKHHHYIYCAIHN